MSYGEYSVYIHRDSLCQVRRVKVEWSVKSLQPICVAFTPLSFILGSCLDILKAGFPEGLGEVMISVILWDVLQALDYLHRMRIIHRFVG